MVVSIGGDHHGDEIIQSHPWFASMLQQQSLDPVLRTDQRVRMRAHYRSRPYVVTLCCFGRRKSARFDHDAVHDPGVVPYKGRGFDQDKNHYLYLPCEEQISFSAG